MLHSSSWQVKSVFFSKKDPEILVPMVLMAIALVWAIERIRAGNDSLINFFLILLVLLYVWATLSTRYEFREDVLVGRSAFLRWEVSLNTIVEVSPARGWAPAAPALSSDRLQINYVHRRGGLATLMVSPEDREGFLETLRESVRTSKEQHGETKSNGTFHGSYMGPAPENERIRL